MKRSFCSRCKRKQQTQLTTQEDGALGIRKYTLATSHNLMNLVSCPFDLNISVSWILAASTSLFNVTETENQCAYIMWTFWVSHFSPWAFLQFLKIPIYTSIKKKKVLSHWLYMSVLLAHLFLSGRLLLSAVWSLIRTLHSSCIPGEQ